MIIEMQRLIIRPFQIDEANDVYEYLKELEVNCFKLMTHTFLYVILRNLGSMLQKNCNWFEEFSYFKLITNISQEDENDIASKCTKKSLILTLGTYRIKIKGYIIQPSYHFPMRKRRIRNLNHLIHLPNCLHQRMSQINVTLDSMTKLIISSNILVAFIKII